MIRRQEVMIRRQEVMIHRQELFSFFFNLFFGALIAEGHSNILTGLTANQLPVSGWVSDDPPSSERSDRLSRGRAGDVETPPLFDVIAEAAGLLEKVAAESHQTKNRSHWSQTEDPEVTDLTEPWYQKNGHKKNEAHCEDY